MQFLTSRSLTATQFVCRQCRRYSSSIIRENENVILKSILNSTAEPLFVGNLEPGSTTSLRRREFKFNHDDIIGKEERDFVKSKGRVGTVYRIFRPTLAEYTDNCPRLPTPIYSQDCALIVSLLDLHPTHPGVEAEKLEIFEAGTGNGSLTLNLARAIHAANTPPPKTIKPWEPEYDQWTKQYKNWRGNRRAVLHTLDSSSRHSKHAETVVKNFMDGMYAPNIDFHIGEIDEYLAGRLKESGDEPFLEHVILDLPGAHNYMDIAGKALKTNGTLILFVPSITQIGTAVSLVKENKLPFYLDKTLEVGGAVGVGGREWDVRPVKPRALLKAEKELSGAEFTPSEVLTEETEIIEAVKSSRSEEVEVENTSNKGWELVCRPKVGLRVSGGGFLGVFKKMKRHDES